MFSCKAPLHDRVDPTSGGQELPAGGRANGLQKTAACQVGRGVNEKHSINPLSALFYTATSISLGPHTHTSAHR